mgnify:FL=1
MSTERWRETRSLFDAARERRPEDRDRFLREGCEDEGLRKDVSDLLTASEEAGDFLEEPIVESAELFPGVAPRRIGPYAVVRRIGLGGMGAVYLAHRSETPLSDVAVKVIKRGMDTELFVDRFRHEREILAGLDHPNIARLVDGGATDDGLPFFVMEYIEGEPIHRFCERNELTREARLDLFLEVCAAVAYAHRHLVVHRDVKPGNILVTRDGVPKLLDFGLAKVLDPDPAADPASGTATGLRMLTPDYASPEQVRGERITTSTDVYSLGVLLYELLTGRRPYRTSHHTPEELARVVCEAEPERPPSGAHVPADLVNVLFMALRKEPSRRYASVDQLAEDVRRYRKGLPVIARKGTFSYRAAKFLKRHRAGVAAASLVVLAVLAGLASTVWQARKAQAERARAERRYGEVRRLAGSLLFELDEAIADLPGATHARELLVRRALEYLSTLETESDGDLSLQRELAVAFLRVGEVQARGFGLDLGEISGALESFHKAMVIRQRLVDASPSDLEAQDDLAESLLRIARVMGQMGDATYYIAYARQAVTIREVLAAARPANAAFRSGLAAAHETLGNALMSEADLPGMLEAFRKLLVLRRELAGDGPGAFRSRCDLVDAHWDLGLALALNGDGAGALESWRRAEALLEELGAASPGSERVRSAQMRTFTQVGGSLNALGQRAEALQYLRRAAATGETLHATDRGNAEVRHRLAETYLDLGTTLAAAGAGREAVEVLEKARELLERWWRASPLNVQIAVTLAGVYESLGQAHEPFARPGTTGPAGAGWRAARSWYQRSLDVWHDLEARNRLARLYRSRTERVAEAVLKCDAALASPRSNRGPSPTERELTGGLPAG